MVIGKRSSVDYAIIIANYFNDGCNQMIVMGSREKISKAVDAALIARNNLMKDRIEIGNIRSSSTKIDEKDPTKIESFLEIELYKVNNR